MMAGAFALAALVAFAIMVVAGLSLVTLGIYVTRRHPATYDPARNAKRYTRPAGVLLIITLLASGGTAFGLIAAGIALLVQST